MSDGGVLLYNKFLSASYEELRVESRFDISHFLVYVTAHFAAESLVIVSGASGNIKCHKEAAD